ncbi:F420-dependent oxidoreductase [Actinotalea ferrariae CF5-4]|uniref:F420-dependent oxidoreductase n=1 Tax=Actinotalea ferrariae CF5-4 TaxID=948458 RepID=A0A021VUS5_9CELL|nr:Pr6Pr family membrane protein [Actinotalea ferrariae]EYR63815.1 F420-dependent oxidoreductase [Actinotalea ferrariae CF5-4]
MSRSTARLLHAVVAALCWGSLAVDVVALPLTEPAEPAPLLARYVELFSYFTILSVLLVGVVSTLLAVDPERDGRLLRVLRLDSLVCITVTGVVYHLLLRSTHDVQGVYVVTNLLDHTVVPVLAVLVWLLVGPRPRTDARTALLAVVLPLVWVGWTFVRGSVVGSYPYPYLDVTEIGAATAAVNTAGVAVGFLTLAALVTVAERLLPPAPRSGTRVQTESAEPVDVRA